MLDLASPSGSVECTKADDYALGWSGSVASG